ncbi:GtrA family protein [Austwickia chelonae]|uniref:GtrA family protein n=1 Tax=Austwickia chelonae TaxID=100225 RepID=UPI000E23571C|nr:GtrA family protein [Austwickia chelonae]
MVELIKRILRHSIVRYLVVGGLSFAVSGIIVNILVEVVGWSRPVSGPVSFGLTFFVSYTLQRAFAFRSEADITGSAIRYLILAGFNTLAQMPIHWICEQIGLGLLTSMFVGTALTTIWNYFAYKHWVYVDRNHPLPADTETVAWHERAVHKVKSVSNIGPVSASSDTVSPVAPSERGPQ